MDYEKKYNNIVNTLQSLINNGKKQGHIIIRIEDIENAIPELKESEDEKIRKEIVDFITRVHERQALIITDDERDNWIAWLEKLKVFAEHGDGLYYFGNNGFTYVGNPTCDNVSWLEKQGEKPRGKSALEAIKEKKVDNANKVEPKFKIGDWITDGEALLCISNFEIDYGYELKAIDGEVFHFVSSDLVDTSYHLWTIEDAKDGDVLVCDVYEEPFLFKGLLDPNHPNCPVAYCGIDPVENFCVSARNYWWTYDNVKPATKEQRNLLYQKMHEAGYEWDANKKELKKIITEQKFKVGDWVVFNDHHEGVYQIEKIENFQYTLRHILGGSMPLSFSHEDMIRLWTIKDAKDGDVLAAHECYVIFKEIDGLNIKCYCTYHYMNNPSFHVNTLHNKDAFHPATKEQRNTLFAKMKEEGYEWDAENKELKTC